MIVRVLIILLPRPSKLTNRDLMHMCVLLCVTNHHLKGVKVGILM